MEQCAIEDNCLLALRSGYLTIADYLEFYQARITILNIQCFPAGYVKLNFASRRRSEKRLGWARVSKIASASVLPTWRATRCGGVVTQPIRSVGMVPFPTFCWPSTRPLWYQVTSWAKKFISVFVLLVLN